MKRELRRKTKQEMGTLRPILAGPIQLIKHRLHFRLSHSKNQEELENIRQLLRGIRGSSVQITGTKSETVGTDLL